MNGYSTAFDLRPESLRARIRWLLLIRVVVVTVFLGTTVVTKLGGRPDFDFPFVEVAALMAIAYALSIAAALALERIRHLEAFTLLQVALDILLISTAVVLTGGLRSPMAVWYNLAILGAGMTLLRRGAFAAAVLASITYGILMNLIYYETLPWISAYATGGRPVGSELDVVYQIGANIASFFAIAFLSSTLVERLAYAEEALQKTEEDLYRVERLQRLLIQNLESGILTTDADGRVESTNRAVESILGKGSGEIVGQNVLELFPVLRRPTGGRPILDLGAFPAEMTYEVPGNGADAKEVEGRTLRFRTLPLTDTYQNPIGTLFILQDITSIKELENESGLTIDEEVPPVDTRVGEITGMVGKSETMLAVHRIVEKVAPTNSTVLVTGESGTGKELVARAIHYLSSRRTRPLVTVNCAAIPENLIESELFGHVRGAFTGAVANHAGQFRAANGGTLFLDEIGDLPLPLQVKLLRVLQERSFTPVGAQNPVVVDVRIIAATNRDLEEEVRAGRFREDLFYRLNVIQLELPPLRDRPDDLPILIQHFVHRFADALGRQIREVGPGAMRALLEYGYPGNVRELENVIEHAVALSSGDRIEEGDLPEAVLSGASRVERHATEQRNLSPAEAMQARHINLDEELSAVERALITDALRLAGGVQKRAAEILGINYRSLRHRLGKYSFD